MGTRKNTTKQEEPRELTNDEVAGQDGEELPAREVMSVLTIPQFEPPPLLPLEDHPNIDPAPPPSNE